MNLNDQSTVYDALQEAFAAAGVDYFLIGARAKDAWYSYGKLISRQTKDIDIALLVGNREDYEAIKEYLKKQKQFSESTTNAFVMFAPDGTQVDILPFGEIASMSEVVITGKGLTNIKVDGLMEVYDNGTETIEMETGHRFQAATLSAIILLKLIAFDDRPERRQKDARDIADMLTNFFYLQADIIYENHNDLFEQYDVNESLATISAIVVGREIKAIAAANSKLLDRLKDILQIHIEKGEDSTFITNMVAETKTTVKENVRLLKNILDAMQS